jgi:hypothetical protein
MRLAIAGGKWLIEGWCVNVSNRQAADRYMAFNQERSIIAL